jgi:hypothetical protein
MGNGPSWGRRWVVQHLALEHAKERREALRLACRDWNLRQTGADAVNSGKTDPATPTHPTMRQPGNSSGTSGGATGAGGTTGAGGGSTGSGAGGTTGAAGGSAGGGGTAGGGASGGGASGGGAGGGGAGGGGGGGGN